MKKINLLITILFVINSISFSEVLDKIAAIVGNEIILSSQVDQLMQQYSLYGKVKDEKDLKAKVLENLIAQKVLYDTAIKDTSIVVDEQTVEMELENRIKDILKKVGGEEVLESKYNTTVSKLKTQYRRNIKNDLFVRKLKQKRVNGIKINRKEINEFYIANKDSLPEVKETITLSQVVLKFGNTENYEKVVIDKLNKIKKDIEDGILTFDEAAKKYSEDGSASNGGNIGWTNRGDLVTAYEIVAYNQEVGHISNPVKTEYGFHLIKTIEKDLDKINTQHILLKPTVDEKASEIVLKKAQSLCDSLKNQFFTFEECVKEYSDDPETKLKNGLIGTIETDMLDEKFQKIFKDLKSGDITSPISQEDGYYIYKINDFQKKHKVTMESDYAKLKEWALNKKKETNVKKWIEELKKRTYIEIK